MDNLRLPDGRKLPVASRKSAVASRKLASRDGAAVGSDSTCAISGVASEDKARAEARDGAAVAEAVNFLLQFSAHLCNLEPEPHSHGEVRHRA